MASNKDSCKSVKDSKKDQGKGQKRLGLQGDGSVLADEETDVCLKDFDSLGCWSKVPLRTTGDM